MPTQPTREQLQHALWASGCALDLDTAMADPTLARCLTLTAQAAATTPTSKQPSPDSRQHAELAWARHLLSLVGRKDWQLIRAGDQD